MAVASAVLIGAGVAAAATAIGGAVANGKRHKAMRKARSAKEKAADNLQAAIDGRQDITNPYAGVTDLSSMASDLSSQITNPFNNLQVSTAAAQMQAEESDIALSNTLDTLEQTGASAGGATALAMASLKGKKDVAASIEEQETKNAELKAKGEQAMIQQKVAATTRHQDVLMEQGARMEAAGVEGEVFQFKAQENRTNQDINRYQAEMMGHMKMQHAAEMAKAAQTAATFQAVGGIAQSAMTMGAGGGGGGTPPSDRRMKKNIKLIGKSNSGLNIYAFEYINKIFGEGRFQGVMSDEIPQEAVIKHQDGYDRVNYSKLDVEFKQI
jgi:hypothetical protein